MSVNNPEVFPHPASQIEGITLFDMIVLTLIIHQQNTGINILKVLDSAKEVLHFRNIAIQNINNYKSMNQIMKEIEDNENNDN